jgi:hypothetical protein
MCLRPADIAAIEKLQRKLVDAFTGAGMRVRTDALADD